LTSWVAIVSDLCTPSILPVATAVLFCTPPSSSRTHFNGPRWQPPLTSTAAAASEPLLLHLLASSSPPPLVSVLVGVHLSRIQLISRPKSASLQACFSVTVDTSIRYKQFVIGFSVSPKEDESSG